MKHLPLTTAILMTMACKPEVTDEPCEPGLLGCEPLDGYLCYDGRPSPTGVCLDTVAADQDVESCAPYADIVSDPVPQIEDRRFCIASCSRNEDCQGAATGFDHDLLCFDIDGVKACGMHDWSARWPK